MKKIEIIKGVFRILHSYRSGKSVCNYQPLRLWIEPTNLCNLKCKMCPTTYLTEHNSGFMSMELFKEIIDQCKGFVFDVFLLLRGEPLLHPQIAEMVGYCHRRGIRVIIHTNATLLNEKMSTSLIESGLDFISFSFDGYSKDIYEQIRLKADYNDTVEKIASFLKMRTRLKYKTPYAIIQNILFGNSDFDPKEKSEFVRRFSILGVNEFRDVDSDTRAGFFKVDNSFVATMTKSDCMSKCPFVWYALTICWDGKIVSCCADFEASMVLGNIARDEISEVWNGRRMVDLRGKMVRQEIEPQDTCYKCDFLWHKRRWGIPLDFLLSISEGVFGCGFPKYFYKMSRMLKGIMNKG